MILGINTSTPVCELRIVGDDGGVILSDSWEAGRELSTGLLAYIEQSLQKAGASWGDLTGLIVYRGPGSFTGLRIGVTVMNTIARAQHIPIVGTSADDWAEDGFARLSHSEDDELLMPFYGAAPNITQPRK